MDSRFTVRRATDADVSAIVRLVKSVVHEKYGHLIPEIPEPVDEWRNALIAGADGVIVGVGLSGGDWIDDLWVQSSHRNAGIGFALLTGLEAEIAARAHREAKLRVFAENVDARRFYRRHGWRESITYPHERWGF